jgi:uncharacterized protein
MFAAKNYQQGVQRLLAACDEELLGTKHSEGKFRLDVTPQFYDGLRVGEPELESFLASCTVANLVGRRAVDVAIRLGLVDPRNILTVGGVPHAQVMVMDLP